MSKKTSLASRLLHLTDTTAALIIAVMQKLVNYDQTLCLLLPLHFQMCSLIMRNESNWALIKNCAAVSSAVACSVSISPSSITGEGTKK